MSYSRVIPRDLFNEGNLLKCYGALWIGLEKLGLQDWLIHEGEGFEVYQDDADGSTYLANVRLMLGGLTDAIPVMLRRPLNSREAYPIYATFHDLDDEIEVFTKHGSLSARMETMLLRHKLKG